MEITVAEEEVIENASDVEYDDDDDVEIDYDDRLASLHHDVSQLLNRSVVCARR